MSFQVQSLWEHDIKLSVQSAPAARANLSIDSSEPLEKSHGGLCFIPSEHISSPVETVNDNFSREALIQPNP